MYGKKIEEQQYQKSSMDKRALLELLREKGCRITKQRLNLIEIILDGNCSSCKEIYYEASKRNSGIGMATIYRMVNLLEEIGALKWRNEYSICDTAACQNLKSCTVEMEDTSYLELDSESIREIFERGMETCGYFKGKKVRYVLIKTE